MDHNRSESIIQYSDKQVNIPKLLHLIMYKCA